MHSPPPAKSEMQGAFFFRGCRRTRRRAGFGRIGAKSGRRMRYKATTHAERAQSVLVRMLAKIGSNVVQ